MFTQKIKSVISFGWQKYIYKIVFSSFRTVLFQSLANTTQHAGKLPYIIESIKNHDFSKTNVFRCTSTLSQITCKKIT